MYTSKEIDRTIEHFFDLLKISEWRVFQTFFQIKYDLLREESLYEKHGIHKGFDGMRFLSTDGEEKAKILSEQYNICEVFSHRFYADKDNEGKMCERSSPYERTTSPRGAYITIEFNVIDRLIFPLLEKRLLKIDSEKDRLIYLKVNIANHIEKIIKDRQNYAPQTERFIRYFEDKRNLRRMCYEDKIAYKHVRYNHICNSHTVQGLSLWLSGLLKDFGLVAINAKSSLIPIESISEFHADTNEENLLISVKPPNEFGEKRNKPSLPANSLQILFWVLSKNAFFNRAVEQQGIQAAYEILTGFKGTQLKKVIGSNDITSIPYIKVLDFNRLIQKLEEVVSQLKEHRNKLS